MKITTGIASTTHIDRHNERMEKSVLEGLAKKIKGEFIPQLVEHEGNKHIGVFLYGEVFQLKDGEYALGIVSGLFESAEERVKFKSGQPNDVWNEYEEYLDVEKFIRIKKKIVTDRNRQTQISPLDNSGLNIADLLETQLDSTQVLPNGIVCKIKRFIAKTGDLRIETYPNDHYPPHFHVISSQRKINARFDIETLEYINTKHGRIKSKDIKKIRNFFKTDKKALEFLKSEYSRLS